MSRENVSRPGGRNAWILAVAFAAIALLFAWVIVPSIFASNPILSALVPAVHLGGSGLAASALLGALKLYLERDMESKSSPPFQSRPSTYADRVSSAPPTRTRENVHRQEVNEVNPVHHPLNEPVTWTLDLIRSLEWKRFEDLCAEFSKNNGLRTETTSLGADGGVDIRLYSSSGELVGVVQCKAWKSDIGVKLIRELAGVMAHGKVRHGVFMTTSSFTPDAVTFAREAGIILMSGQDLLNAIKALPDDVQQRLLRFATEGDYTTPTCPHCGVKMVLRKGYSEFWGCRNYPRCREKIPARK